jgi:hypothetical protein
MTLVYMGKNKMEIEEVDFFQFTEEKIHTETTTGEVRILEPKTAKKDGMVNLEIVLYGIPLYNIELVDGKFIQTNK